MAIRGVFREEVGPDPELHKWWGFGLGADKKDANPQNWSSHSEVSF